MQKRSYVDAINALALSRRKMAFISGPRQCGKTTLAKAFLKGNPDAYYNWDDLTFRRLWTHSPKASLESLPKDALVIYDEIHKAKGWKQNLKGVYDTLESPRRIVVTGSARLDLYKKGSDSLMGRYVGFRLHPFSQGELHRHSIPTPDDLIATLRSDLKLSRKKTLQRSWSDLFHYSGFPEPLLAGTDATLNIWRRGRVDKIVREDLRDLSRLPELSQIEMLVSLLPERAASPLSIRSLREDLEVSYDSVKRWLAYLRQLYFHFELKPWSHHISRSLKKEGKLYLWDWSEIEAPGSRFENMVAAHLLKACHYWTDTGHGSFELHYLKSKEKHEIDFLIVKNRKPWLPVECKLADTQLTSSYKSFHRYLAGVPCYLQLVHQPGVLKVGTLEGVTTVVMSASEFMANLP